jgi:hypothetical protein
MVKSKGIEALERANLRYITALTNSQIAPSAGPERVAAGVVKANRSSRWKVVTCAASYRRTTAKQRPSSTEWRTDVLGLLVTPKAAT